MNTLTITETESLSSFLGEDSFNVNPQARRNGGGLLGRWKDRLEESRAARAANKGGPRELEMWLNEPVERNGVALREIEHAAEYLKLQQSLEAERKRANDVEEQLSKAREELELHRKPRREVARFKKAVIYSAARELCAAKEGRIIEKCASKTPTSETRLVAVSDDEFLIRWCHGKGPMDKDRSTRSLDLRTVHRIEFGHETITPRRVPGSVPWLCFSLRTWDRSYDFLCPDEDTIQCFMLALSRILPDTAGAVPTRQSFIAMKAWCKVKEVARRNNINVHKVFVRAVRRTMGEAVEEASSSSFHLEPSSAAAMPTIRASDSLSSSITAAVNVFSRLRLTGHQSVEAEPTTSSKVKSMAKVVDARTVPTTSGSSPTAAESAKARQLSSAAMQIYTSGKAKWPKAGEVWVLKADVNVYRDRECTDWVNRLKCKRKVSAGTEQQFVAFLTAEGGHRQAEIQGTEKMKFVRGWIEILDASCAWTVEPS